MHFSELVSLRQTQEFVLFPESGQISGFCRLEYEHRRNEQCQSVEILVVWVRLFLRQGHEDVRWWEWTLVHLFALIEDT